MDRLEIDVHMDQPEFDSYVLEKLSNAQSQTLNSLITDCKTLPLTKTAARKSITYGQRSNYNFMRPDQKPKLTPDFDQTIRAIRRDYSNEHLFNVLVRDNGFWDFNAKKIHLY